MKTFNEYHLSNAPRRVTPKIPGPKSQALLQMQREMEGSIVSYPVKLPIAPKRAHGAVIEDEDGNYFLDFFAGCGVLNVGHSNQYVLAYVKEQQEQLVHALDFPTANKMALIVRMLQRLPAEARSQYKVSFCGPTGSDAVEAAIKLAKYQTGRSTVVAFQGSYHGMTSGSLAVTSNTGFRTRLESLIPNVHFIPYSYCYRCPFKRNPDNCGLDCAEYFRYILENPHSGIPKPAAVLLEPIQGEGGTVVPKAGFLEKIVEIARAHGVVVIFDEIQCGFFRTGSFLASQDTAAMADIYTLSKGLGGIGFPVSALMYRKDIEAWESGSHVGTFRANQAAIAAGNGAFDFIAEFDLETHVREMGAYLMDKLAQYAAGCAYVGEVRGKGLFIGIEFVKDTTSKTPYPEFVAALRHACFQRGLLFEVGGHYNNVVRLIPPLIINREIADHALRILTEATARLGLEVEREISNAVV